jgi:hypothetical protein
MRGWRFSQRPITTFCWLPLTAPPASALGAYRKLLHHRCRVARWLILDQRQLARRAAADRQAEVEGDALVQDQPSGAPFFRNEGDARFIAAAGERARSGPRR